MRCPECGFEVEDNAQFCRFCGNEIVIPKEKNMQKMYEKTKEKNDNSLLKILVVLLFAIIIMMLCIGGFWFWFEWQDTFYKNNNTPIQEDRGQYKVEDRNNNDGKSAEVEEKKIWGDPYFRVLRASSEYDPYMLDNGKMYTYYVEQIRDNNHTTAWTPDKTDSTPWIKFSDTEEQKINGIIIENGYSKTEELYYQNLRAKDILIECDDFKKGYTLSDKGCQKPEIINFDEPVITKNLKITILSTYESIKIDGVKFDDLSITEIEIF